MGLAQEVQHMWFKTEPEMQDVDLTTIGLLPGTPCTRHVAPCTADGMATAEVTASTVAYGLVLAGYGNVDIYNYLRARVTPADKQMVTEYFCYKLQLQLVDTGSILYKQVH